MTAAPAFRTNIFSFFFMTKAATKRLKKGAAIINTTSVTAYKGSPHLLDYSSTKGAITSFTRSPSQALADKCIRVNGIAPGTGLDPTHSVDIPAKGSGNIWVRSSARSSWPNRGDRAELCIPRVRRFFIRDGAGLTPKRRDYSKWLTTSQGSSLVLLQVLPKAYDN